ncbi:MAG: hypothetical protein ACJ78V_07000 [Myxococcales bacterium]
MKLLNVRLGPDESRIVAELRRDGVQISRLVRDALHSAYRARQATRATRRRPSEMMAAIYSELPDPPGLPRRRVDLGDRQSMRRAILRAMKRQQP